MNEPLRTFVFLHLVILVNVLCMFCVSSCLDACIEPLRTFSMVPQHCILTGTGVNLGGWDSWSTRFEGSCWGLYEILL